FGVQLPAPSWGNMVQTASESISRSPWLLVPTGGAIIVTIMSLMLVGDSVRDAVAERWTGSPRRPIRASHTATAAAPVKRGGSDALLEVNGLTIVVDSPAGPVTLVEDVSFTLNAGESLCLVG